MNKSSFVYVIYIRTTPEKLWDALLKPEFTRQYWFGVTQESSWTPGAAWKMVLPDGTTADTGEILEIEKPKHIVIRWRNEFRPELNAEGYSVCRIELEPAVGGTVLLSFRHESDRPGSKLIEAVSGGWPKVLSSLKSLLESGTPLGEIGAHGKAK
jgi:uncharacterized protein YndB with AHSA1/START domain